MVRRVVAALYAQAAQAGRKGIGCDGGATRYRTQARAALRVPVVSVRREHTWHLEHTWTLLTESPGEKRPGRFDCENGSHSSTGVGRWWLPVLGSMSPCGAYQGAAPTWHWASSPIRCRQFNGSVSLTDPLLNVSVCQLPRFSMQQAGVSTAAMHCG